MLSSKPQQRSKTPRPPPTQVGVCDLIKKDKCKPEVMHSTQVRGGGASRVQQSLKNALDPTPPPHVLSTSLPNPVLNDIPTVTSTLPHRWAWNRAQSEESSQAGRSKCRSECQIFSNSPPLKFAFPCLYTQFITLHSPRNLSALFSSPTDPIRTLASQWQQEEKLHVMCPPTPATNT